MTLPEDFLRIDTPENVAFGYDVAGIGSRFLAAIVDTIVIIILQIVVNLTVYLLSISLFENVFDSDLAIWLFAIFGLIAFIFLWGYYIIFEMVWNGQSLGKRWVGLRVIRTDGTPITLPESIIRNLVRLVDFLPAYYGVGVVTMFINEQSRRLGDLAAGTLVVRDRSTITLESLASKTSISDLNQTVPVSVANLPVERLTDQTIQIAEDFLRRHKELANSSAVSRQIIQALYEQMKVPPPELDWFKTQRLLEDIVQAYKIRQQN